MYLRYLMREQPKEWSTWIKWVQYCYDTSVHLYLAKILYELLYRRDPIIIGICYQNRRSGGTREISGGSVCNDSGRGSQIEVPNSRTYHAPCTIVWYVEKQCGRDFNLECLCAEKIVENFQKNYRMLEIQLCQNVHCIYLARKIQVNNHG